jgi:Flp pilus assembly pilin Flp
MNKSNERREEGGFGLLRTARRAVEVRRLRSEAGQTPTEYLMIVGIMAAVILIAFITFFWNDVKGDAQKWSGSARDAIQSTDNAPDKQPTP